MTRFLCYSLTLLQGATVSEKSDNNRLVFSDLRCERPFDAWYYSSVIVITGAIFYIILKVPM